MLICLLYYSISYDRVGTKAECLQVSDVSDSRIEILVRPEPTLTVQNLTCLSVTEFIP